MAMDYGKYQLDLQNRFDSPETTGSVDKKTDIVVKMSEKRNLWGVNFRSQLLNL